ncbi:MAG: glycosyltransferase family 2 protein [Candidatus Aenigmarchaeota archaeon]|nr:glycosyltransferase family 2 protein [Candidatus Aenigmarchaeota archaeon]
MTIAALIPTKNEEEGIGKVIDDVKKYVDDIYIIDCSSTDKTQEIAKKKGAKIILESRKGYGRAYKTGFNKVKADIIVTIDADGSYSTKKLGYYIKLVKENKEQFISCNRIPKKNSMSFTHEIGNKMLTKLANILFWIDLKDSQTGMWIFDQSILKKIVLEDDGMPLSEEIKIKVIKSGTKFVEFPVDYYPRLGEAKINTIKDGANVGWFLLKLRLKTLFN